MPTYDYHCLECERPFQLFFKTINAYAKSTPECPRCHTTSIKRRIGRIAVLKGNNSPSSLDDSMLGQLDPDNPQEIGRMMQQMGQQMGQETGEDLGDEFHELTDRLTKGQSPEQIEKEMPHIQDDLHTH